MNNITQAIKGRRVDITALFSACNIETSQITIIETSGMYPYKKKIENNWAYFTTAGLKTLKKTLDKEGKIVSDIGIVGICSGVEAIAVLLIFRDHLRHVIVTDIDNEILKGTMYNLGNFSKDMDVEITPLVGSFCEPIEKAGYKVDFVHGNIPNLPASGTEDLSQGAEKGTFLPAPLYEKYAPPEKFVGWALGAQYAYLKSAKAVLKDGGTLITELGGRVPMSVVSDLFEATGLKLEEVVVGFKEQTEALIDFIGYHRMEKKYGVEFEFYLFDESKALLKQKGCSNPTTEISGKEMKAQLEPYKVSARKALNLHKQGITVGHTVHLFRGIK